MPENGQLKKSSQMYQIYSDSYFFFSNLVVYLGVLLMLIQMETWLMDLFQATMTLDISLYTLRFFKVEQSKMLDFEHKISKFLTQHDFLLQDTQLALAPQRTNNFPQQQYQPKQ